MKNVLLIKGQSQYNAMRYYIDEIEMGFRLAGYNTIILDANEKSFRFQLDELPENVNIDYIFTCNAILYRPCRRFFEATYITYLCDHPARHRERLQDLDANAVVFTCDALHAAYIEEFCPNVKNVMYVPLSGSYSKKYIPYRERKYNVVFTGSYCNPEKNYTEVMNKFEGNLKIFAEYMLKDIITNPLQTLETCLENVLEKVEVEVTNEEFHELVSSFIDIDTYARNYFRDKAIRLLIENGIQIHVFGNGWENFESEHMGNLIIEKGNSYVAQKAVANAKISLNLMPWFKAGFQERIATAMLSGTICVTDESQYINQNFENGKELFRYSLMSLEELPALIEAILENENAAEMIAANAKVRAENELTWQHRTFEMINFIRLCENEEPICELSNPGEILRIPYKNKNSRVMAEDIIAGVDNILEMLSEIQSYDQIDVCDIKYLYTEFLFLYMKAQANFQELNISDYVHEQLMNLEEDDLQKGLELLRFECANLQALFLRTEYRLLKAENQACADKRPVSNATNAHEQEVLVQKLLRNYENESDEEIQEILETIKSRGFVTVYNQKFTSKYAGTYEKCLENVYFDEDAGMHYVLFKGKRMYYPKKHSKQYVASQINFVNVEQDMDSPHRYVNERFGVQEGDIVIDAGVAEGNFALEIVDIAKKIYLVECEHEWVEALEKTFEPWKEKVVIVEKMLGATDDELHVSIDGMVEEEEANFIKMDVEGAEVDSLKGASRILTNSKNIRCAICSYHRKGAEKEIRDILEENGFFTTTTKGYMFFKEDIDSWIDGELRRGIIRATKL